MGALPIQRLVAAVALLVLGARPASSEGPERALTNTLGVQANPIGLEDHLTLQWSWDLSDSTNPFLADAHFAAGVSNHFSPAYDRLELWVELSPLSVLDLRAGVEPLVYFGSFGHIVAFPSYDAPFGKEALEAVKDQAVSATGVRYHFTPIFKIKLGRVVARTAATFEWWRVDAPGPFFYEPWRDTLLDAEGDELLALSSQLLYEFPGSGGKKILAGAYHELVDVHDAPQNRRQRLGPLVLWTLGAKKLGVREPTVIGTVYTYVEDPNRDGELGGFLALTFGFGS